MRRILTAPIILVAACSQVPSEEPRPAPTPTPVAPQPRESGTLVGLTGGELVGRLGRPALQIKEGNSLKVQFRGRGCVLDAFLYPGAGAQYRVTHVETRALTGADTSQESCISQIEFTG